MNSLIYEILKKRNIVGHYQKIPTRFSISGLWNSPGESFQRIPILHNSKTKTKTKITFRNTSASKSNKSTVNANYQRVTVKANYLSKARYGAAFYTVFNKHLSYITRNGACIEDNEKKKPELFTESGKTFTTEEFANEKNIYKYVLSPEHGDKLNMREFTIDVMKRAQQELGVDLIWTATVHNNTGHPHAHIVVRGVDMYGKEITMPKDFQREGLRNIASREATIELGFRTEKEIYEQKTQEITQDRFTELDKRIKSIALAQQGIHQGKLFSEHKNYLNEKSKIENANYLSETEKNIFIQKLDAHNDEVLRNIKKVYEFDKSPQHVVVNEFSLTSRMDFLCKSGFATKINNKGEYELTIGYERVLKEHGMSGDRVKNMYHKLNKLQLDKLPNGQRVQCYIQSKESTEIKSGQVILKDLDEHTNKWNVLIKTKNNVYYQFEAEQPKQLNHISENTFVVFSGKKIAKNKAELVSDIRKANGYSRILSKENLNEIKEKYHLKNDIELYREYSSQFVQGKIIEKGSYKDTNFIIVAKGNKNYLVTEKNSVLLDYGKTIIKKFEFDKAEKEDYIDLTSRKTRLIKPQGKNKAERER